MDHRQDGPGRRPGQPDRVGDALGPGEPPPPYYDGRDFTPFRDVQVRTPVRGLAEGVGGAIYEALGGRNQGRISVAGDVPRIKRLASKPAKALYEAIFTSTSPERLITLAREYPGWAGLCIVMAGLLAYKHGSYLRAAELLRRGLQTRIDDDASQFSATYLTTVVTRVEVSERIEVPVLFSEESVFLALSHCLRETGQTEAALDALSSLPPSLPTALARCTAAAALGRHREIINWTEGLLNADDLSAALLLLRARSQRALEMYGAAFDTLREVLRRRKTSLVLKNDALTDRALLALDVGRRALIPRRPIELEPKVRRHEEMHRLWDSDFRDLGGDDAGTSGGKGGG